MSRPLIALALAALYGGAAGCSETFQRMDGVTPGAGDAMAANTVMQMVDPWQYGVQDTDLQVPADRGEVEQAAQGDDAAAGSTTSGNGGSTTDGY